MKKTFDAVDRILPGELLDACGEDLVPQSELEDDVMNRIVQKSITKLEESSRTPLNDPAPQKPKKRSKKWITALIAAALLVVFSISVAAEVLHWDYRISKLFQPTEEQMITYMGMNVPVTDTAQDHGITVLFGTAFSDGFNLYLPATIIKPAGTDENTYFHFLNPEVSIDGNAQQRSCFIEYPPTFYDDDIYDNQFPILIQLSDVGSLLNIEADTPKSVRQSMQQDASLNNKKIEITLNGLAYSNDYEALSNLWPYPDQVENVTYLDGTWKVSFTMSEQQQYVKQIEPQQTVSYCDGNFFKEPYEMTVDSITLSPISFQMILTTDWNPQDPETFGELPTPELCGYEDLKLLFKDGTIEPVNYLAQYPNKTSYMNTGAFRVDTYPDDPPSTKTCTQMDFTFKKLVDINEVEAVLIDDNVIPIK